MQHLETVDKNARILIVDDEASIRLTFEMFLAREGYGPITTASTFDEALLAIRDHEFDLIISDIVLEGARGTDLLRKIRGAGLQCPVVMVTGFPNLDSAAEAVRYGAFDYVSKPVNKETLLRFVRHALRHWELEKEKKQLIRENERYKRYMEAIFSSVRDAIVTIDNDMNIVQLNNTAKNWMGYDESNPFTNIKSLPEDMGKSCLQEAMQALKNQKEVRDHHFECRQADNNIRMISLNASPLQDEQDEFSGVVIVARDITLPELDKNSIILNQFHGYVGSSQVMQSVYKLIENVGKVDTAVLITGESGTGKELAAEALHAESPRRDMPLIKVDCAAITEDLLESELFGHKKGAFTGADRDRPGRLLQADHSTLFLDEIGDISPRMQLRLLRFLQEKTFTPVGQDTPIKVDVRVIAATNVNLIEKVRAGNFREDLYYRLKVVEINLPPLRDRNGGIPLLAYHFLSLFRDQLKRNIHGISDQAMNALSCYYWPGNVRELRHMIERACVLCEGPIISLKHFPEEIRSQQMQQNTIPDLTSDHTSEQAPQSTTAVNTRLLLPYISEKDELIDAMKRARGNKSKAARMLNVNRSTLYRKMQRLGIQEDEFMEHSVQNTPSKI
ncbi:MAG: sigma-54-dependent Fis family transcriptional regulator [Proteobacteria bacterium]|jgi:PAS domain S-box-containing protein|nr:sigma-54-dependent Fis family transcriptional regulator [Desulfocapsa sp.]MBU3945874.1 sigma-54-dependent Fis family transcriptional regulator [Pseudomonadota bacterium]MCG2745601.1 sigma-54-dependent Fis family transcriptional regulator [Desulfobacteraceae bacterium]MBU4027721.1 sigma-54-dependent Fis family transcriptional regulator [Pseudomonadota bacterium]MBU4042578.1 sigma-54-dependent Fis family transcriptional regulator [Pseudomonadota bacterium]